MLLRSMTPSALALGGAVIASLLLLPVSPGRAQRAAEGPFVHLAGSWSGSGTVALASGAKERIRCRSTYQVDDDGRNLRLELRCASDSYNFELRASVAHSNGQISGTWTELTRRLSGNISGSGTANQMQLNAVGQTFAASLSMTTRTNQQSISIQSPGSEMSGVTISLNKAR